MARALRLAVGTFVRVPLADKTFGYGRVLSDPYMAFYRYRTEEPSEDLTAIAAQPIMFIQAVRLVRGHDWIVLGDRALEDELAKPVVRFMQDLADYRKCTIFDSVGLEKQVEPEACIGIERAEVWDPHHIAQRLLDTFMGQPNVAEVHARVRLR
ncbi:MAG: immunity 26/phosphotriesterase HocA family protein [Deltaproteobacteria bacterium]|nr:immunity 26/phosphotriesterase HocA family protein [Deltaproteobacteria bacterium]